MVWSLVPFLLKGNLVNVNKTNKSVLFSFLCVVPFYDFVVVEEKFSSSMNEGGSREA